MLLKDVKKGDELLLDDGRRATRADSVHSMTPSITAPSPIFGGSSTGSVYCWQIIGVYKDGGLHLIEFTESQKKWIENTKAYCRQHGML
jgi:hypothetical protein